MGAWGPGRTLRNHDGSLPLGALIGGRYAVTAPLGRGGMGTVYRVLDRSTGRDLALKQLGGQLAGGRHKAAGRDADLRFRREFQTMAGLRHPRIVEVFDYGHDDTGPYYTMELLDGRDLRDLGVVSSTEACRLLRDVASALALLHTRRLLHRDLAPRNVRCTADGHTKLIDFGVLATVGSTGDVAGTPPYLPPENLRRLPLDHRADLFGLGALAYRLLTGRNAFPARKLEDLEGLWKSVPPPPSALAANVPETLDALVLSLLSIDPLARPASAAEVIDRLTAIGGIEPLPESEGSAGYLASAAMVGRQQEMQRLRRRLRKAMGGEGRVALVVAPSGMGKSRLLRELGLEAQLAGATVLQAGAESAGRGPYGVVRALARELLVAAPADAVSAAQHHAANLARVFPELHEILDVPPSADDADARTADPAEARIRLQSAVAEWFLEVAASRALVFLVDDLQRCDEASAAVLATLAHAAGRAPILLAASVRSGEKVRAAAAVASIRDTAMRVRLGRIRRRDVEQLVENIFGAVPNAIRLSRWIHELSAGSPLHCTEIARSLVDRELVRWVDGEWVVPDDFDQVELPAGLADAMDARIQTLGESARSMAEVLSIYGGSLTLERCVLVAEERDEMQVFAALDDLVQQEILVGSGERFRFRHDGLREALLRGIDTDRRTALQLWVGERLADAGATDASDEAEIGWLLFHGGERRRGATYLERAGRRLYHAQSFADAIPLLSAALEVNQQRSASPRVRLELQHLLLLSGCMADRDVAREHADPTVEGFAQAAGVSLAARLGPFIGRYLALGVGLAWSFLRWAFSLPGRRGPNPVEALRTFFVVVGYAATVQSLSFDVAGVRRLVRQLAPIAIFQKRVPYAVYLLTRNLLDMPLGRTHAVRRNAHRLLQILATDHVTPISEMDRKTGEGGARFMLALLDVAGHDAHYVEELARLEKLGLRFFEIGAHQAHITFYRVRGEEDRAREAETKAEVLYVQLGSVWQMRSWLPVISSLAYGFTRDVLGLRRTVEALSRLVQAGYAFEPFLLLARGEYERERGELPQSLASLRDAIEVSRENNFLVPQPAWAALAETHLAAGDTEEALAAAHHAVALSDDPEHGQFLCWLRAQRTLGLAAAAHKDTDRAAAYLDDALERSAYLESPIVSGGLHEARARVALVAGDTAGYELHLAEVGRWFRPTRNPALMARLQQLELAANRERRALHEMVSVDAVTATSPPDDTGEWVSQALALCRGPSERSERALHLILQATGAMNGFLFLRHDDELRLAAPTFGAEPPDGLTAAVLAVSTDATGSGRKESASDRPAVWLEEGTLDPWHLLPLFLDEVVHGRLVGAVALKAGVLPLDVPAPSLLSRLASAFAESGDVTLGGTLTTAPGLAGEQ